MKTILFGFAHVGVFTACNNTAPVTKEASDKKNDSAKTIAANNQEKENARNKKGCNSLPSIKNALAYDDAKGAAAGTKIPC